MTDSDSVNLGSNPSPPATTNIDISATTAVFSAAEQREQSERTAHEGRTETGTVDRRAYRHDRGGFVYFITDGTAIKIGYSVYVQGRLADLQGAHPANLTVIDSFRGMQSDEQALHRRLGHLRIRGEWFRDDPELRGVIAELAALRHFLHTRVSISDVVSDRHREQVARLRAPGMFLEVQDWLMAHKKAGWPTPEIGYAGERALFGAKVCIMNKPHPAIASLFARHLAEYRELVVVEGYAIAIVGARVSART